MAQLGSIISIHVGIKPSTPKNKIVFLHLFNLKNLCKIKKVMTLLVWHRKHGFIPV